MDDTAIIGCLFVGDRVRVEEVTAGWPTHTLNRILR